MSATKLSGLTLSEWYDIIGINPWHGFQLSNSSIPLDSKCNTLTYERVWGNADRVGRREIRNAIERAEEIVYTYAHYWPFRRHTEVTLQYPKLGNHGFSRWANVDSQNHWVGVQTPEGHVHSLGYLAESTPIEAVLTYQDLDGDGLFETAVCTVAVPSGTLTTEIVAQFISDDIGTLEKAPDIPIRKIVENAENVTLTFDTWNLVRPIKYQGVNSGMLDPNDYPVGPGNPKTMARSIQVFRRRTDPTGTTLDTAQAIFVWESEPYPAFARSYYSFPALQTRDPSAMRYVLARGNVRDSRSGIIYLGDGVYDEDTQTWSGRVDWGAYRSPDRVIVRYEAGNTDNSWKTVIARLAAAELTRPICACTTANKELAEWQWDLSRNGGADEVYSSPQDVTNPIGSRRGHVFAWRTLQQLQRTIGFIAG